MTYNVYVSNGCSNCHNLLSYLKDNSINHVVRNISTDRQAAKHLVKELKVKSVPVVESSNGEYRLGNDPCLKSFLGIC